MPERIYNKITTEKRQVIIDMYLQEKPIKEICDTTLLPKTTITSIINVYKKESRIETKRKGGRIQLGPQNGIKVNVKRAVDSDRLFSYKQILLKATDIDFVKSSIHKIIDNFCYSINLTDTSSEKKNDAHTMEERFRYAFQYFRCVHEFGENNIFFLTEVRFSIATRSKKTNNDEIATSDEIKVRDFSFYSIVSRSGILHRGIANTFQDKANYIKFVYEFIDYLTMKRFYNCVLVLDSTIKNQLYDIEEYVTSNSHYVIYLPAYSPMLNPVLSSIDKVKCIVAAANAQNEADILKAVEFGFNSTTLTDIDDFYLRMIHFIRMSMAKQPIN